MPDSVLPELDDAAFTTASLAYIESQAATTAGRVRDSIRAYLYATENIRYGLYPSWHEVRTALGWNR